MGAGRFDFRIWGHILFVICFLSIFNLLLNGCGGSSGEVTAQGAETVQVLLSAKISSSVPVGGGTVSCNNTCEFSFTVQDENNQSVIKAQNSFPNQIFKCNAEGVPASGQGFTTVFVVDPNETSGTIRGSCGPAGASIIDTITFSFFTSSEPFSPKSCQNNNNCNANLTLISLGDQVTQSGALALLETFSCPTLKFLHSFVCTTPPPTDPQFTCSLVEIAQTAATCEPEVIQTCGNNKKEGTEECDGSDGVCAEGKLCGALGTTNECKCVSTQAICGNGTVEAGEACEFCPDGQTCGPIPVCDIGLVCSPTQCTCSPSPPGP